MIHRFILVVGVVLAAPARAFAHSPIEGMNDFYNGVLHPALVPSQLMLLIALGLYLGQRDVAQNQAPIASFLVAAALGLMVTGFTPVVDLQLPVLATTIVVGALVAADWQWGRLGRMALGLVAGLLLGLDSAQASLTGLTRLVALFGCYIGMTLLLIFPMALADRFNQQEWQRIGVRVTGSWLVAAGVMVVAFLSRSA
ncbi:MAG: HupE/UreJ family protein [Pseudomonadota bacterium]|nr:HupE/UreJ family protein [Pseudomonadota bacterium]